jgi:hypothetical protein
MKRTQKSRVFLFSALLGLLWGTFSQQAIAQSGLTANPTSLKFGSVAVNTLSSSQAITLVNTGNRSITIQQAATSIPQFAISGPTLPIAVAPGQTASFLVAFMPNAAVKFSGSIDFSLSHRDELRRVPVSGTGLATAQQPLGPGSGVQPQLSVQPSTVSFGNVPVGSTNTQTMTISNPGSANLTISQSSLSGVGFSATGLTIPLNIAPGAKILFTLAYTPAAASAVSGTLTLVSNAPGSPASFTLSGSGLAQTYHLSASPASLSFAATTVGNSSASQTVTLTNTGNSTVTVSQLSSSSTAFGVTGLSLPLNLAAGQFTNFSVLFAPLTAGSLSGSVSVASTATNSPATIALSGSARQATSSSVNLTWSDSSTTVSGFNVYRGATTGGPYAKVNSSLVPSTTYSDTGVQSGSTYYYVTTAVGTTGAESSYSNESAATIP